jgi:ribonuclease Z
MALTRLMTAFAAAVALAVASPGSLGTQTGPPATPPTAAIVFGVGSPNITAERSGTSIGIAAGGTLYIFDAGPGVERRIMEARSKLDTLRVRRLGPVFITHMHWDHTLGLAALLAYHGYGPGGLRSSGVGSDPLTVYGPVPAESNCQPPCVRFDTIPLSITEFMNHLSAAFYNVPVNSVEIHPGVVYRDANITVSAFEVVHIQGSFGYRIQANDRTIVISGDTVPVDAIVTACNGCDLLFHEVFGLTDNPSNPTGSYHTNATALGELARRARPKHLVLYHDVQIPTREAGLAAIAKAFSGKVTFANDLDVF